VSSAAGDPYLDPASGVLRNLLGITDAAKLARAEAALSASRLIDLERRRLPGRYDLAHLQAFHRYILGDVYDWAGQLRTVSIDQQQAAGPPRPSPRGGGHDDPADRSPHSPAGPAGRPRPRQAGHGPPPAPGRRAEVPAVPDDVVYGTSGPPGVGSPADRETKILAQ